MMRFPLVTASYGLRRKSVIAIIAVAKNTVRLRDERSR